MNHSSKASPASILLMVAGAKGAVASTLAVATTHLRTDPESIRHSLTTAGLFPDLPPFYAIDFVGWDRMNAPLITSIESHGVLPKTIWADHQAALNDRVIRPAPSGNAPWQDQIDQVTVDIECYKSLYPQSQPVLINLLPAGKRIDTEKFKTVEMLFKALSPTDFPDLTYVLAAIRAGIPVVNFSPNMVEAPPIVDEAVKHDIPIAGCDGKTGQTYFKVALASALKARRLFVDGWYSLNLLGNADGENLMDPERAVGKVANKTELLDEILGYRVGNRYDRSTHTVRIDYYPPRGDAKEAWDVVDFNGLFGLPMSIRLNLQGRDSILAAPMVLDLARWMVALKQAGRSGLIPELGFFFKKPMGANPPLTFQDQIRALEKLAGECGQGGAGI